MFSPFDVFRLIPRGTLGCAPRVVSPRGTLGCAPRVVSPRGTLGYAPREMKVLLFKDPQDSCLIVVCVPVPDLDPVKPRPKRPPKKSSTRCGIG